MQTVLVGLANELRRIWPYRWLGLGVTIVVMIGAFYYISKMPDQFSSTARIYVGVKPPASAVAQGMTVGDGDSISNQIYMFRKTLLGNQSLDKVLAKVSVGIDTSTPQGRDAARDLIKSRATVTADDDNFITISYWDTNPIRARDVTQALLDQFISDNVGEGKTALATATKFLDEQIASYEAKLSASEKALTNFRLTHMNVIGNESYSARVTAAARAISAAQAAYQRALTQPSSGPVAARENPELAKAEDELAALRRRFTDNYPDVVAKRREVEQLRAQTTAQPTSTGNTTYGIAAAKAALTTAQERLRSLRSLQDKAPKIEAQYAELTRTNALIRNNYEELLGRLEAAKVSAAVDQSQNSSRFRITTIPEAPLYPTGPDRQMATMLAMILAIGSGVIVAYLRAVTRGIMVAPGELETTFGLPVIGTVSLEKAWQTTPRHNVAKGTWIGVGALSLGACAILVALQTGAISARTLNPKSLGTFLSELIK